MFDIVRSDEDNKHKFGAVDWFVTRVSLTINQ